MHIERRAFDKQRVRSAQLAVEQRLHERYERLHRPAGRLRKASDQPRVPIRSMR